MIIVIILVTNMKLLTISYNNDNNDNNDTNDTNDNY